METTTTITVTTAMTTAIEIIARVRTRVRLYAALAGAALLGGAGGCATSGPFADLIDHDSPLGETAGGDRTPAPAPATGMASSRVVHLEIPEDAGPEQYVRLALERNPAIRAADERVRRLANRIPQAESLDDPMLFITPVGEMAETAAGRVDVMSSVSQKLPFPGKLRTRGRIAAQTVAQAVQELQQVRLRVAADTRRTWWSFYYMTRAIEVTEQNRDLLAQFRLVAEAKYRAGTATQQDVLRASVEMSLLDDELIKLRQRRTTAVAMLNQLLDRPVDRALPAPRTRELEPTNLQLDAVLAAADRSNPEMARIHERIEGYRQQRKLARLNRWPDLTLAFSYNLVSNDGLSPVANGLDQWWIGAGINLPIWASRLNAAEFEAARGMLQSISELDSVTNQVAFRVQDALTRVESQQRQVILFRDVIIPQARQAVDVSLSGYRTGKLDFLTLVDNWRKLFEFQVVYHLNLAEVERSFADLQQAVGRTLDRNDAGSSAETRPREVVLNSPRVQP